MKPFNNEQLKKFRYNDYVDHILNKILKIRTDLKQFFEKEDNNE